MSEPISRNQQRDLSQIKDDLQQIITSAIGGDTGALPGDVPILDLGVSSLALVEGMRQVYDQFGVLISIRKVIEGQATLNELALYIHQELSRSAAQTVATTRSRHWKSEQKIPLAPPLRHVGFLCRYSDEASAAYNEALVYRLEGLLDGPALQAAVETVSERYEALRTSLNPESDSLAIGAPGHTAGGEPLELNVFSASTADLDEWLSEIVSRPFEIGKRLFRAELLRLSEKQHVLVLVGHSLVLDIHALQNVLAEVLIIYEVYSRNGQVSDSPPVIQWKDYLAMGSSEEATQAQQASERYWKDVFSGGVPRLELPGDFPRPAVKKYSGARLAAPLEVELFSLVRESEMKTGVNPATQLLAAFAGYLHRLTGQHDLVIGVESEPLYPDVGLRAIANTRNMLPVLSNFNSELNFQQFTTDLAELVVSANRHRYLSFSELIQLLDLPPDQSRSPVFTAAFRAIEKINAPMPSGMEGGVLLSPSPGARYDLEVIVIFSQDGASLVCDYSPELFDEQTISRWLQGMQAFLKDGLENGSQPVSKMAVMPSKERELILNVWNETKAAYPKQKTVLDLITEAAGQHLDRPALQSGAQVYSYRELLERIDSIAAALHAYGVVPGDRVGLLLKRSIDTVPAMLATWRVGALYVPADTGFPNSRINYMFSDANVKAVIVSHSELTRLGDSSISNICLEDIQATGPISDQNPDPVFWKAAMGPDSAMILYTSGSTGKPKGVEVRHSALVNVLAALSSNLEFTSESSMLAVTTISFDIASNELFMPLLVGGKVIIGEDELAGDGIKLAEKLDALKPTHIQATVSTFKLILTAGWKGDPDIRLISAGEALDRNTAERLLPKCLKLWNVYGPTETTVYSTIHQVRSAPGNPMLIGRPLPNTQLYVLDLNLQPVPVGAVGDLYIGGDGLAVGYWQKPELTGERFISHPFRPGERLYKTGDLARYLPDGNLICLGRLDDQVKIHGVRVELGEIETVLKNIEDIEDAVVVAWLDERGDKQLVGHLIGKDQVNLNGSELRKQLRDVLPEVMIPTYFVHHHAFPMTANGKIHRVGLPPPAIAGQRNAGGTNVEPPSTNTERVLSKIWAKVLGIDAEEIGRDSDFMDLGGHSLLMTSLLLEVRKKFQVSFSIREFFAASTLRKCAAFIDGLQPQQADLNNGRRSSLPQRTPEWAKQRMVFLQRESELPRYIAPGRGLIYRPGPLQKILLTGATGFLGAYIVAEILGTTRAELYCLVRPKRGENPKRRIENQMRKYKVWSHDDAWQMDWGKRLHIVDGDITLPRMGLPDSVYEQLSDEVDAILHGAAHVNFIYPYEALRATNVLGLHEIIQFAFHGRIKPVHHISTAAIWPMGAQNTYFERDSIDHFGALNLGYDEAKWVGEKCLLNAADRGLPVARYRPGEIGGDSQTGHCITDHFIFACLKGFLQFGAFPSLDIEVDVAPVDYVARSLVYLMFHRNPLNRAFHLTNPSRRRMSDALAYLRNLGYQFDEIPFEELRDRLVSSDRFSQNALFAYQAVLEDMDDVSMQLPIYDTSQVRRELEGSGISCPPADEKLLETYLKFLREISFIPSPERIEARLF